MLRYTVLFTPRYHCPGYHYPGYRRNPQGLADRPPPPYIMYANTMLIYALFPPRYHYPGSVSIPEALQTDRPLWASEDYSAHNDITGGGCWARVGI